MFRLVTQSSSGPYMLQLSESCAHIWDPNSAYIEAIHYHYYYHYTITITITITINNRTTCFDWSPSHLQFRNMLQVSESCVHIWDPNSVYIEAIH